MFPILLTLHISGALIALLSGWAAVFFRKGSRRHGVAGTIFFVGMLTMTSSAACMAVMHQQPPNLIAAIFTLYLVSTARLAVTRKAGETGLLEFVAMLVVWAVGTACWIFGWQVQHHMVTPGDGVSAAMYFVFGSIALLCTALDVRMLTRGISEGMRLARHLWRMCFALFIATASAISGKRAEFLPGFIRRAHLHVVPVFAILLIMIFWLGRVWFARKYRRAPASTIKPRSVHASA